MSRQKQDAIPPVAAVTGSESFLVREAVRELIARALGPQPDAMALTDLEGDRAVAAEVLDELRTLPFLGERRVVLVRGADGFISDARQLLEKYVEAPSPTGVLILACKSLPANTRLYKLINQHGTVIKCEAPRGRAIVQWIAARARDGHGKSIEPAAAARLRELTGDDLGLLDAELEKLAIFALERRQISLSDVQSLVGMQREETVFGIVDAMLTGDLAGGLRLWSQVWATDRAAPARAIGGLAWALRQMIQAKASLAAGAPAYEVARRAFTDPERLQARLRAFSIEALEVLLCDLRDADLAAKTGGGSVRDAIERLIVRTAQQASGRKKAAAG